MEIIFHGNQQWDTIQENLCRIIALLHEQYHINQAKEIHLSLTLMDDQGFEIDLVDSETQNPYRVMEVFSNQQEYLRIKQGPALSLVVDNTKPKP
jgi:hypothetical protein